MTKGLDKVIDDWLATPGGTDAQEVVAAAVDLTYRLQLEAEYGPRCPDFEPGCVVCQAYREYDRKMEN